MTELHVTVSDSAKDFIYDQVAAGHYGSASELISELVEQASLRAAQVRLVELLDEGNRSGLAIEVTDEWLQRRKAEALSRLPGEAAR